MKAINPIYCPECGHRATEHKNEGHVNFKGCQHLYRGGKTGKGELACCKCNLSRDEVLRLGTKTKKAKP